MVKAEIALQNETRRMIYNHIAEHPGVSYKVLKKIYGIPDGTLRYHLDYLVRTEMIVNNRTNGKRIYYPTDPAKMAKVSSDGSNKKIKLNGVQRQLLMVIKDNPGINQKELTKKTRLNRFKIRNNVEKLIECGMVKKTMERNKACYDYISEGKMQYEIIKMLAMKLIDGEIDDETFLKLKDNIE
jgi:predicted transcriptional regulator